MNSVMTTNDNHLMMITLNVDSSRSTSPMTPSPSREIRGIRLFRAISRKLARRSNEDFNFPGVDTDSRSSSSDSCSSSTSTTTKAQSNNNATSGDSSFRSMSPNQSSSSSDAGSDSQSSTRHRHHHSTSAESIRRVFQNLSLNTRSQSCNNTKEAKRKSSSKKVAATPKRILRAPVTYTYVKGLSGLPTQRIPKNQSRIYMNSTCGCSMQYMAALHR